MPRVYDTAAAQCREASAEAEEAGALLVCARQEMERRLQAQASEASAALAAAARYQLGRVRR